MSDEKRDEDLSTIRELSVDHETSTKHQASVTSMKQRRRNQRYFMQKEGLTIQRKPSHLKQDSITEE